MTKSDAEPPRESRDLTSTAQNIASVDHANTPDKTGATSSDNPDATASGRPVMSLRRALALLLASGFVPALIFVWFEYRAALSIQRSNTETQTRELAREVAANIDRELAIRAAVLRALAPSPAFPLDDKALRALYMQAHSVGTGADDWIVLVDASGTPVFNTRFVFGADLPGLGDIEVLRETARSGTLRISDLFKGAERGRPLLSMSVPAEGGRVLTWRFRPEFFVHFLREQIPTKWTATLLDRTGTIVARSNRAEEMIGRSASADFWQHLRDNAQGFQQTRSLDDVDVYTAWQRLEQGWTIVVFVPQAVANEPLASSIERLAVSVAALGSLALGLSVLMGGWILREFRNVSAAAIAVASGRSAPLRRPSLRETFDIQQALKAAERAGAARRLAERAMRESEARFREMADHAPVMIWVTECDGAFSYLSRSWYEFTGQTPSNGLSLAWRNAIHPDNRVEAELTLKRASAERQSFRLDYRMRRADGVYRWMINVAVPRFDAQGVFFGYIGSIIDITERRESEQHIRLLLAEVSHRAKNMLAVVQAMVRQSARHADNIDAFQVELAERIGALAKTHDLLIEQDWRGAPLRNLIEQQLAPFIERGERRAELDGPDLIVTAAAAQHLSLAIHELATNAAKHGALAATNGSVKVTWTCQPGEAGAPPSFQLCWSESGGPPLAPIMRRGFGSFVLERMVSTGIGGEARFEPTPEGLSWTLTSSKAPFVIAETPPKRTH